MQRTGFGPPYPHCGSQPSVTPWRAHILLWLLRVPGTHTVHVHTYRHIQAKHKVGVGWNSGETDRPISEFRASYTVSSGTAEATN